VDLSTWNVREYKLESGEDVAFVLYRPITHGLRTRHLELSLRLQAAVSDLGETGADAKDGSPPDEERIEGILASQMEAEKIMSRFREELLSGLVVGCRDLTLNDKVPTRDELLVALLSLEDLATALCAHIIDEGTIGADEGKD